MTWSFSSVGLGAREEGALLLPPGTFGGRLGRAAKTRGSLAFRGVLGLSQVFVRQLVPEPVQGAEHLKRRLTS